MDRRIKFRHLEVFGAIARTASLKRAAQQLNLTQPAVSKTLKELEVIAGHRLADRSRAGVTLTVEGEMFLAFAEQSIAAVKHGLRSIQGSGGTAGRLKVGALPSVASSILPDAVTRFVAQNPDTLVEVVEGPHSDLTTRLRSGSLDVVIGRLGRPDAMEGLIFQQLYTESVAIVARPDSPALGITDVRALNAFRVVYPPKASAIRPLVARMLIALGVPLFANRIETSSAAFGRALILSDPKLVWIITHGVVADDLRKGNLAKLSIDTQATQGAVGIMTRAQEVQPARVRNLVRCLR